MEVSFTPRQLYSRRNSPLYSLNRGLGGLQSRSGCCEEVKNLLPLPGTEPRFLRCPALILVTVPTELSRGGARNINNLKCTFYSRKYYVIKNLITETKIATSVFIDQ
jgi:hypothetical protein